MPSKEECFFLGYVSKPFGYKGELVVFLDVDDISLYNELKSVLIEIRGALIPYFIEEIKQRDKDAIWRFEDLSTEESLALVGSELYLPLSMLPPLSGNKFYFHEVIGFEVVDKEKGSVGVIKEIYDQGPQPIFSINNDGKEIMIPLIDDFLIEVDRDKKLIKVAAPEGLIDFYTS